MKPLIFAIQTFVYCRKALKRMMRNRTQLFFVFLFPVLMLVMMGFVFGGEGGDFSGFTVGVVNLDYQPVSVNGTSMDEGNMSDILIEVLQEVNITTVEVSEIGTVDTNGTALNLLARNEIDAFLVIPKNFTECLTMRYVYQYPNGSYVPIPISPNIEIVVNPTEPVASNVVKNTLVGIIDGFSKEIQKDIIQNYNSGDAVSDAYMRFLASPVTSTATEADITVVPVTWINFMVPGTLGLVILWAGFANAARGLARERDFGTLRRLIVASASPAALLLGEYLYNLIVIFLSAAFALATGVLLFHVTLNWDFVALIILTLLVSMSAIGPGLIISSLAKNGETAGAIQTVVAIPLQFFTGSFFPLFLLPSIGQAFALALPYTQYSLAVSDIMVKGLTLADVCSSVVYIALTGIVVMVGGIVAYRHALRKL